MKNRNKSFLRKAKYQEEVNHKFTQCLTCERKCKIERGKVGYCQTRKNVGGVIYSLVYGCIPTISKNPIEKKPLYHFFPGSKALTIGTYGCNFSCFWCQNHHISHPDQKISLRVYQEKEYLSPADFVKIAKEKKCQGTSISFNEPTLLFEYSLDIFKLAKENGLYNTYVSNGYMTEFILRDLIDSGLDAINIDIKGNQKMVRKYCGADVEKVWRNAKIIKESGIHVEITTLLIDGLNSNEEFIKAISERICKELGECTPYHLSRFFPHYKSSQKGFNRPTSVKILHKSYNIAKQSGLKFVYLGNLYEEKKINTVCPKCGKIAIRRDNFTAKGIRLDSNGNCSNCGFPIAITS
ncbi:MAG: AmmeMemoRadiSam system radical SAM enzyme [Candidatus Lokiarchaeota archaeon]|nr:AmmeMemoRadiSam system radical SAM enzyme [Candidatus Lokiarchaeota archaeon]MBD3339767.1 AmmeMemoRadiSam system radical SAM enzyme [Candidatus Lokiarchaeota archaeon]